MGNSVPGKFEQADEDYIPKSILITGGAGFIASHVVLKLGREHPEYKITVLDKCDYCASVHNLDELKESPNFHFVKGDIQSMDLVAYVMERNQVDTVMHFAAQTHVDNSFGNSLAFTMNNTFGTHVLLEASRKYGKIRRFVNVSTDEVYGESSLGKAQGLDESSTLEPTNPYSAAKAAAEMVCMAYINSYNFPIIITRGNNVYGPHQFPEKMIPKFTLLASQGRDLPVHGDGGSVRSYLFVEDVADAFYAILHKGKLGEVYNIGTDKERSVLDVAQDICKLFNLEQKKIVNVRDRAFNDRRYFIGCEKLAALGWVEKTPWEVGLQKTVDWYLKCDVNSYWESAEIEGALQPHPTIKIDLR
eukprot:TRINITY_DN21636_c0_g1_i1.p1 TRINITY_DN21636_c0_g1~~TRINITY_DN21636_c0_g1_i1.p1  ORF type:complete len:360 (-),score=79.21 TRINITY_DN21636_c0_g1_i1:967-2046(-)